MKADKVNNYFRYDRSIMLYITRIVINNGISFFSFLFVVTCIYMYSVISLSVSLERDSRLDHTIDIPYHMKLHMNSSYGFKRDLLKKKKYAVAKFRLTRSDVSKLNKRCKILTEQISSHHWVFFSKLVFSHIFLSKLSFQEYV